MIYDLGLLAFSVIFLFFLVKCFEVVGNWLDRR